MHRMSLKIRPQLRRRIAQPGPAKWRDLLVHPQHIHRIRQTVRTYSTFSPVAMIAFPFETSRTALPCLFTTKYTTRGGVPLEGIVIVAVPVQSAFTVKVPLPGVHASDGGSPSMTTCSTWLGDHCRRTLAGARHGPECRFQEYREGLPL
ncbi:MAG: hypothetical protein QOH35_2623 [Acidobacteriaceae bacterium]|nr:hypothetical protein [Acidobacteriaceae bacterium]